MPIHDIQIMTRDRILRYLFVYPRSQRRHYLSWDTLRVRQRGALSSSFRETDVGASHRHNLTEGEPRWEAKKPGGAGGRRGETSDLACCHSFPRVKFVAEWAHDRDA